MIRASTARFQGLFAIRVNLTLVNAVKILVQQIASTLLVIQDEFQCGNLIVIKGPMVASELFEQLLELQMGYVGSLRRCFLL